MTHRSALGYAFHEVPDTKLLQIPLHSQPGFSSERILWENIRKMTQKLINFGQKHHVLQTCKQSPNHRPVTRALTRSPTKQPPLSG